MKKGLIIIGVASLLASCGGYTDDQKNASKEFCDCMDKDTYGDFDINFFECDLELTQKYDNETFADEGWSLALEENCPSVAGKIGDSE